MPVENARVREAVNGRRRSFLRTALSTLTAPAVWLLNRVVERAESLPETAGTTVTVPVPKTVLFRDRFIAVNNNSGVTVLSSRCTHLGCRIQSMESGELVCPCHGSRFSLKGDVVHGPATRNLETLPFDVDRARNELTVHVKS